ncbi:MAG TPA: hypothetical protein VJO34_04240 [Methylomirabilota bacterium]|nr:hypothetical protein [Methylomirabilota bacterium]
MLSEQLAERLGAKRPVELVRFSARPRHDEVREQLLLVGRKLGLKAPHQLSGRARHPGMRKAILFFFGDDHVVDFGMGVAGAHQPPQRHRDVGLLIPREEVKEDRRAVIVLEDFLGWKLVKAAIRVLHEAGGHPHPAPVDQQFICGPKITEKRAEKEERHHPFHGH